MRKQTVEGLLGRLPDFMAEERGRLKKRAFCKDYWREGKRVHGVCEIVRSFGGFLWLLNYAVYREFRRGRPIEQHTKLIAAACLDNSGRYGRWVTDEKMEVEYVANRETFKIEEIGETDISPFKYISLDHLKKEHIDIFEESSSVWGKSYLGIRERKHEFGEEFFSPLQLLLEYPQTEFVFKLEDDLTRQLMLDYLLCVKQTEDEALLKDLIAAFRLGIKHRIEVLNENSGVIFATKYGQPLKYNRKKVFELWFLSLILLRQMGKDIRNPHFFDISVLELDKRLLLLRAKVEGETKWEMRLREASDYLQFRKIYRKFDGMKFKTADGLEIHTLATPEEYAKETEKMRNNIAGERYQIIPESLILVARRGEKSVADIELHFLDWSIGQCFGHGNTTPSDEKKIKELILRNIDEIKRRHSCA